MPYEVKQFTVAESGSFFGKNKATTEAGKIENLYDQIAAHANKYNLKVVKISQTDDAVLKQTAITVLFEK